MKEGEEEACFTSYLFHFKGATTKSTKCVIPEQIYAHYEQFETRSPLTQKFHFYTFIELKVHLKSTQDLVFYKCVG